MGPLERRVRGSNLCPARALSSTNATDLRTLSAKRAFSWVRSAWSSAVTRRTFRCYSPRVADVFSKKKRSQVMAAIRSRGNRDTEVKLVAILRAANITGWRRHLPLPGCPDFVFKRERVAVFVDGCFWHRCPKHGRQPETNPDYWAKKLARNKSRDSAVSRMLRKDGWTVVRLWEHHLSAPVAAGARIKRALGVNRRSRPQTRIGRTQSTK